MAMPRVAARRGPHKTTGLRTAALNGTRCVVAGRQGLREAADRCLLLWTDARLRRGTL
eukprot:gene1605-9878_t